MYGYEIFHDAVMTNLIRTVHEDDAAHAYIFEGVQGLGTETCARLLAAALTCRNKASSPCGACPPCVMAKANTNPDIIFIDKQDKKSIGVEPIRELTADAAVKPFESDKKVYIIREANIMTESAQNAFLKTLEEPPHFVTFILLVQDSSALLQTVLSRCVLVKFPPVSPDRLKTYIHDKYPEETRTDFLCKYAQGNPGIIDRVIADETFEPTRTAAFSMLTNIISPQELGAYQAADFMKEYADRTDMILDFWIDFMRDILLIQTGNETLITNSDLAAKLTQRAQRLPDAFAVHALDCLVRAKHMARRYVNTRALTLNLCFCIKDAWKKD